MGKNEVKEVVKLCRPPTHPVSDRSLRDKTTRTREEKTKKEKNDEIRKK